MVRLTSILLTLAPLLSAQFISPPPTSDQIQAILNQRLEQKQAVSLVAAILDPQGKRTVAAGPAKPDAIFELGSLSGTFTTLVLQTMVANGEVALTDTVSMYLPNIPSHGSKQITLLDLATHTSGLPNLPLDFPPPGPNEDPALAYTRYTDTQAMAFLASYQLTRDPGKLYEHSDLGIALLARALVRRATVSYETLLRRRILTPLGMNDTRIDLDEFQRARLAPGHIYTATGIQPRPSSDTGFFAPALGLHSTAKDLLVFVSAYLNTPRPTCTLNSPPRWSPAVPSPTNCKRPSAGRFASPTSVSEKACAC
ncbi:MAG: serine hydrolase domain-containing protein [Acidobacteriota bacterium]